MPLSTRSTTDETYAERGRAVTVMRQHPETGMPVPNELIWGLIPHDAPVWPHNQPTHARAEAINELPMFREAYRKRRCILPVDSFQQEDVKGKRHSIALASRAPSSSMLLRNERKLSGI